MALPGAYPPATRSRLRFNLFRRAVARSHFQMNIMTDMHDVARTTLLIDGSHVDRLRSKLGRVLDLERLITHFEKDGRTVAAHYYRDSRDAAEQGRLANFFDWLSRHNIERYGADDFVQPWYVRERYGSNLVHLAVDAMTAARNGDHLVLLAGDAKLIPLVRQLRRDNVSVTLFSSLSVPRSIAPPPPLTELADHFIDLGTDDRFFMPSSR